MALRYRMPAALGDERPKAELVIPPYLREPTAIEFRAGCDMSVIAKEIRDHVSVKVVAAVGSGKSTILPKELALAFKTVVFHVTANPLLVSDLYSHVSKLADSGTCGVYPTLELHNDFEQEIPRVGVYYMSAAEFVTLMIREKKKSGGKALEVFGQPVVFLDEAHESDACTHIIRELSLCEGAGCLVQASATFGPGGYRPRESAGKVVMATYPQEDTPETWDIEDRTKPWYYAKIRENLLVFTDSRSQAAALCSAYSMLGLRVYRLAANMDKRVFDEAMAEMRNKKGELVVLIADSSFRSGFTYWVGTIIDTMKVAYYDPTPGRLVKRSRTAFSFEVEQAAGRGGRIAGLTTTYYRPDYEPDCTMCDLEGVEMEVAAYLYRVMGYRPNRELKDAVMASFDLPAELSLVTALNGTYPLSYWVYNADGKLRSGAVASVSSLPVVVTEIESKDEELAQEVPPDVVEISELRGRALSPIYEHSPEVEPVHGEGEKSFDREGQEGDKWRKIVEAVGVQGGTGLDVGSLCEVRRLPERPGYSLYFPRGLESVLEMSRKQTAVFAGLADEDREIAMSLVLSRYNLCVVEAAAGGLAMVEMASKIVTACTYPEVKRYFAAAAEKVLGYDLEQYSLYGILKRLETVGYTMEPLSECDGIMQGRKDSYSAEFAKVLKTAVPGNGSARRALQRALDGVAAGPTLVDGLHGKRVSWSESGSSSREMGRVLGEGSAPDSESGISEVSTSESTHRKGRHRHRRERDSHRSESVASSSSSACRMVVSKMPWWTGVKTVAYESSEDGEIETAELAFRPFMAAFTGKERYYSRR